MNADGSGDIRMTELSVHDAQPSWSPDGQYIAFESDRTGDRSTVDIFYMRADTPEIDAGEGWPKPLTHGNAGKTFTLDWSPDMDGGMGSIAFSSNRSGAFKVYVGDVRQMRDDYNYAPQPLTASEFQ